MARRSPNGNSPAISLQPLAHDELPLDTIALAKFLVGKMLVRNGVDGPMTGRIVETEAYPPGDDACHARSGRTQRNASLFLARGHVYVYRAYGSAMMLNISSEEEGTGAGVLVRAAEPLGGIAAMHARRGVDDVRRLARGPGCLAQAFDIDFALDGKLYAPENGIWLADDGFRPGEIANSKRIGITRNADQPWRYFVRSSPWVSGPAWLNRPQS